MKSKPFENISQEKTLQHFLFFFPCVLSNQTNPIIKRGPFLDNKILDWSKLKQIADNILKCT